MKPVHFLPSVAMLLSLSAPGVLAADFEVTRDVIYGQGTITVDGKQQQKDLWMDTFIPAGEAASARPAVIMTHGGSFHRGHPRNPYRVDGAQSTSMAEYCEKFAAEGYACFAISYRLAPELPVPSKEGYNDADFPVSMAAGMDQVNIIRNMMGLRLLDPTAPSDVAEIENAVYAAAEDLRTAIHHVRSNAETYGVDADKMVLGGFSAGATTVLNAVHSLDQDVSGIFMLSVVDVTGKARAAESAVPTLMFQSQNDLPAMFATGPELLANHERIGADFGFAWVPGFNHFYPSGAVSLGSDGTRMPVEERIFNFVERVTE